MTPTQILVALKALKDGESIDLLRLPDLTAEELAVFESRDVRATLERMLAEKGITPDKNADRPDVVETGHT